MISLSAKGLTHGEICAHLAEVYGAQVSKQTISTIPDHRPGHGGHGQVAAPAAGCRPSSSGRDCHSAISDTTVSVILDTVSFDTDAP